MPFSDPTSQVSTISGTLAVSNPNDIADSINVRLNPNDIANSINVRLNPSDIANSINVRFPWESGQLPVCLTGQSSITNTTGTEINYGWDATTKSSFNRGPITVTGLGSWAVPNGYRFRMTGIVVKSNQANSGGYIAIAGSGTVGGNWYFNVPYQGGNMIQMALSGYEVPGGAFVSLHIQNFGVAASVDVVLYGVCYLP